VPARSRPLEVLRLVKARSLGRRRWVIAGCMIPGPHPDDVPQGRGREAVCFLNATDQDAHIQMTIFYADREPIGPYRVEVHARRILHLRFDGLFDPARIPRDTEYACVIDSDVPVVVQPTHVNPRQAAGLPMTRAVYAHRS
jgi:hypothetical protein